MSANPRKKPRTAGSSSEGTEDSDFSTDHEHVEAAERARRRSSTRLTRASLRLSQSSQAPVAASVFSSGRRITRSQQGAANPKGKKYPLRQSRSSGSDTEANGKSDRESSSAYVLADRDETPPRTPTGNAPSSESDIDVSSPSNEHDERLAKELSMKEAAAHDLSHRPKRRRFHESYNFNMKCPTPGCNSLGSFS
uniref:Uncharacterized protein n=1 Tax=Cyprinodon variegatus TaxID=28743 RepID=A0A3Q2D0H9_CYPVA